MLAMHSRRQKTRAHLGLEGGEALCRVPLVPAVKMSTLVKVKWLRSLPLG